MSYKLYIVACEASGDTHAAHLVEELKKLSSEIELRGTGGPLMQQAGVQLDYDMTTISSLGLGDVIRQYGTYRRIFKDTIAHIREFKPDAVVVLDSPAFNLRLAKKISKDFPVVYYISPQIWAWGMRRIKVIKRHISKMLCILPFEVEESGIPSRILPLTPAAQITVSDSIVSFPRFITLLSTPSTNVFKRTSTFSFVK